MTCPRKLSGIDHWNPSNDVRVCSNCGSLHPDDVYTYVLKAIEEPQNKSYYDSVVIIRSDQFWKYLIILPDVSEPYKFYTYHVYSEGLSCVSQHEFVTQFERALAHSMLHPKTLAR